MTKPAANMPLSSPTFATDGAARLIDIADHPVVMRWMEETARRTPDAFNRLIGPNERRLETLFGRPAWRGRGMMTRGWHVHENGLHWVIQTGPGGTLFRWQTRQDPASVLADARIGTGSIVVLGRWMRHLTHEAHT